MVRAETPPLARLQALLRSPFLDSYFAVSANLGTHTFFMIFLPIMFWCDYIVFGRALVNLLASGVIVSGFMKDLLCLPRPVSPPIHRITMSGSAALEYGFPSTHTTNAMSVVVYAITILDSDMAKDLSPEMRNLSVVLCLMYVVSIGFGRLYCGMHGFTDVVSGGVLGALLTGVHYLYGERLNDWVIGGSIIRPIILMLLILVIVRAHPEPADNCPCFDDSVAFSGVVIGINFAYWQ